MSLPVRVYLQDAFLLHRRPYRETSLLLNLLTREFGVVGLVAKGARRGRGQQAALLRPFCPLSLSWAGRSNLPTLTAVEARGTSWNLLGKALFCGFYLNELLVRLLPAQDPQPGVFALYEAALQGLASGKSLEKHLRLFELALLDELGYGPDLHREADSGRVVHPDGHYRYQAEMGLYAASPGVGAVRGSTLLGLRNGHLNGVDALNEAKRLMREILHHHLGGRPLKSRELFKFTAST